MTVVRSNLYNFVRFYLLTTIILLSFSISTNAQEKVSQTFIEGSNGQWFVDNADRAGDIRFAEFLGRQALWVKNNTHIIRSGIEFVDGTIEFDVAPMDKGNFVGILFRRESFQNQENIYLRAHRSGLYNAMQYAPRINGSSTWQLYPEFNSTIDLPRNQWTHIRVEVQGTRLEVYVNYKEKPALIVPRLRGNPQKGSVAFWGRVNDQPNTWAAALSNISIRPSNQMKTNDAVRPTSPVGTLTSWEISNAVQNEKGAVMSIPQLKEWNKTEAEESGLVNINRVLKTQRGRWTAFARKAVRSEEAKAVLLELGYTDDVTVFLNGEPVYIGVNGFESRHPEYMGFVKPEYENIFLKLKQGNNEIVLAVTDDQRFGWGFVARMKERK